MAQILNLQTKASDRFVSFDGQSVSFNKEPQAGLLSFGKKTINIPIRNILNVSLNEKLQIHALLPKGSRNLVLKEFSFEPANSDDAQMWIDSVNNAAYQGIKREKRFKVFVNPNSGTGKAKMIFDKYVKPIYDAAKCTYDVFQTRKRDDAKNEVQKLDLNEYDAIIAVSGDGTVHELVNGLLSREEFNTPIGVIPGGSGNALSFCILGDDYGHSAAHAALTTIKGKPTKIDICSIKQGSTRFFSFLSQAFGIGADLDLGTEHLRWMGSLRFTYGALKCILLGRRYPCKLEVKIVESDLEKIKQSYRNNSNEKQVQAPSTKDVYGSVNDPVPSDWTTFTDDIIMLYAGKLPSMTKGALFFPCALPSDGYLDLTVSWKDRVTRMKALNIMDKIGTGKYIDLKEVEYYKVKAFRLTPRAQDGFIAIDGEKVPFEPFQVEVHQQLITVLTVDGKYAPQKYLL